MMFTDFILYVEKCVHCPCKQGHLKFEVNKKTDVAMICQPPIRSFIDNLTVTTTTLDIQARSRVLSALEDSFSLARKMSRTEEGARGQASQDADLRKGDPFHSRKPN